MRALPVAAPVRHRPLKWLLLAASALLVLIGLAIEDRGLAMMRTNSGEILYPISSGSEDGAILKIGLVAFSFSGFYAIVSLLRQHKAWILFVAYSLNSLFYLLCLFLVSLDSSLIGAAWLGDWLPLTAAGVWSFSAILCGGLTLRQLSAQPLAGSEKD